MDEEHWRPFEGRYGDGFPLIGAVSKHEPSELEQIEYPWCIHVLVHCDVADDRGYPPAAESAAVDEFSATLLDHLRKIDSVIEAARLTGHGGREYWWYVREPAPMHMFLEHYAARPELFRAFNYDIELDPDRELLERFAPD